MKNIKRPHILKAAPEIGNFSLEDDERLLSEMPEALSGPLFDRHDVKTSDVKDPIATVPSIAPSGMSMTRSQRPA